jgi:hypothetical protein
MKKSVHFFVGTQLLGSSAIEVDFDRSQRARPLSTAFFCEQCGEVWARAMIQDQPWEVWALLCEKHQLPYPFRVPGSMWLPWNNSHNMALPPAVLRREVELHLAIYDRFKEMYQDA